MIKKILLSVLLLFVTLLVILFGSRMVNYLRDPDPFKTFILPRLQLAVIEITSLSKEKIEMNASMYVKNQMPVRFKADSLQYKFFINDVEVMATTYKGSIDMKGNDTSWITLPLTLFKKDLINVLKTGEAQNQDSAEYRIQASFFTKIVFNKIFKINISRLLPLARMPEVKLEHFAIDSLNFSRAATTLLVSITSKNPFSIKTKDIAFEFSIEDNEWVKGVIPGLTVINSNSKTEIEVPVRIDLGEVRKTLFDLMKKGMQVNYRLHLTLNVESENKIMKSSSLILESAGTVKSLLKAIK